MTRAVTIWLRTSFSGKIGAIVLSLVVFTALGAPWMCRHSPFDASGPPLAVPNLKHWLGTDDLGIDLCAQICFGLRNSLLVGLGTAFLAGLGGTAIGLWAGYRGGMTDRCWMRLIDILLVLPDLPVMIVLAAFFGPSIYTIVVALSLFVWVYCARIVRAQVLSLKGHTYIQAAEGYGAGVFYLIRRHFFPEVFPLVVFSMIRLSGRAIVAEAGLSFLGLGDPTSRSLGLIIHHAMSFKGIYYTNFWKWWLLYPWLALIILLMSLSLVGRDLERIADPRMSGG